MGDPKLTFTNQLEDNLNSRQEFPFLNALTQNQTKMFSTRTSNTLQYPQGYYVERTNEFSLQDHPKASQFQPTETLQFYCKSNNSSGNNSGDSCEMVSKVAENSSAKCQKTKIEAKLTETLTNSSAEILPKNIAFKLKQLLKCSESCSQEHSYPKDASECLKISGLKRCWLCNTKFDAEISYSIHNEKFHQYLSQMDEWDCLYCKEPIAKKYLRVHLELAHFRISLENRSTSSTITKPKIANEVINNEERHLCRETIEDMGPLDLSCKTDSDESLDYPASLLVTPSKEQSQVSSISRSTKSLELTPAQISTGYPQFMLPYVQKKQIRPSVIRLSKPTVVEVPSPKQMKSTAKALSTNDKSVEQNSKNISRKPTAKKRQWSALTSATTSRSQALNLSAGRKSPAVPLVSVCDDGESLEKEDSQSHLSKESSRKKRQRLSETLNP